LGAWGEMSTEVFSIRWILCLWWLYWNKIKRKDKNCHGKTYWKLSTIKTQDPTNNIAEPNNQNNSFLFQFYSALSSSCSFGCKIIKLFLTNIKIILIFQALTIYLWTSQWGNLDKSFFFGTQLIMLISSVIITLLVYMGYLGVLNQTKQFGMILTGRKLIWTYQLINCILLVCELYGFNFIVNTASKLKETSDQLSLNSFPSLSPTESSFSSIFNSLFFAAVQGCS
jgi:hypothetical protein